MDRPLDIDQELAQALSNAVRRARLARGLSQEEAAALIGTSLEFFSKMESGLALPSFNTFTRLALTLQVSADELLGNPRPQLTDDSPDRGV